MNAINSLPTLDLDNSSITYHSDVLVSVRVRDLRCEGDNYESTDKFVCLVCGNSWDRENWRGGSVLRGSECHCDEELSVEVPNDTLN